MKTHQISPTPQYFVGLATALFLVSWICSAIVSAMLRPNINNDAVAYITLIDALRQSSYNQVEAKARQAQGMTSDPDIRKLADLAARNANLSVRAGSQTPEEANSITGFGKAFATGWFNPIMGIEGGLIFLESIFTDVKAIGNRLDARYQPVFKRYSFAGTAGTVTFWLILVGGGAACFYFREHYEQQLLRRVQPIKLLNLHDGSRREPTMAEQ